MSKVSSQLLRCAFGLCAVILISSGEVGSLPTPIVLWHGMGDSCCNPLSLGAIQKLIEKEIPGVYVKSLRFGSNSIEDTFNGFFLNANKQIAMACDDIRSDPHLNRSLGYHAVGFSQGGQFLRAVVQRCGNDTGMPRLRNLISVGGQHQGVFGFPRCPGDDERICEAVRRLLNLGVYTELVQEHLVQAEYWHDPLKESEYREKSVFLADLNQENQVNSSYRANLLTLDNMVLVKFLNDTMVDPKDSEWFEFYQPGQDKVIQPLNETRLYQEDRLGLKTLVATNRLRYLSVLGDHLQFTDTWFIDSILQPYLR